MFEEFSRFLSDIGNYSERAIANTAVDGGTVDTCRVSDSTKPFETAIEHPAYRNGDWIVVELYDTKEEATAGHNKWVKYMEQKPVILSDVTQCDLEHLSQKLGHTLRGSYERNVNYK